MSSRVWTLATIIIGLAALLSSVTSFERVRASVSASTAHGGTERHVTLPVIGTTDAPWRVVTVRLVNGSSASRVGARVGEVAAAASLAPYAHGTLSLVVNGTDTRTPLALDANTSDWRVDSIHVSNAHGFTSTIVGLTIVPAAQPVPRAPAWAWLSLLGAAAMLWRTPTHSAAHHRWVAALAILLGALLVAALVLPYVSDYRLIVSPRTFALALVAAVAAVRLPMSRPLLSTRAQFVAAGLAGACFFTLSLFQQIESHDGRYHQFLHMAAGTIERAPFLRERPDLADAFGEGHDSYDAQFMYLMAFDPLLRRFASDPVRYREVVDFPPYRYGRIGFSWLTAAVTLGRPERFPAAMMWLIIGGHVLLGLSLAGLARQAGHSPWLAPLYVAIPGFMASLQFGLPESLAAAGLVAGVLSWLRGRHLLSAVCFAGALLIRETGLLLVLMCYLSLGTASWQVRARWLAAAVLPFGVWRLYVAWVLWPDFGVTALAANPQLVGWPLQGLVQLVGAALSGEHAASEIRAALVIPVVLVCGAVLVASWWTNGPRGLVIAGAGYAWLALSLDYAHVWQHVPSGERTTLEFFLTLLLLTIIGGRTVRGAPMLAAFWTLATAYTFLLSPEAPLSRAATGVLH